MVYYHLRLQRQHHGSVYLIGPYTVQTKKKKYELRCMTMVDPVTNWFEIAQINSPSSEECQRAFDSTWLARYPRPQEIGFDNGGEFKKVFHDQPITWDCSENQPQTIIRKEME